MSEILYKSFSRHIVLTEKEQATALSFFSARKYKKKQYILQQDDVSRHENFIVSGLARTYETDDKGEEHILQFGIEGWWMGDLYSFLTSTPSVYDIDCLEDCEVLQITRQGLDLLYGEVPKIERYFRILFQNAFISTSNRVVSNLSKSAAERYEEFLEKYPSIGQRITDKQIASYLGITPQSLSRIRTGIKKM